MSKQEKEKYNNQIFIGGGQNRTTYRGVGWKGAGRYRSVIKGLLNVIGATDSGKILFDAIWKRVLIIPVLENATDDGDLMGSARTIGSIDLVSYAGNSNNVEVLTHGRDREAMWDADTELRGKGSECLVQFTPGFYDSNSPLAQSFASDFHADALLFHELVHASRGTRGVADDRKTSGQLAHGDMSRYTNNDEFFAILLTNIYRSERYRTTRLRASHAVTFEHYQDPASFWKGTQFRRMMDTLFQQSPSVARGFAKRVRANWNPIRDYYAYQTAPPSNS